MNARCQKTFATLTVLALLIATGLFGCRVSAQQITGLPGSPNATVTLDGKQLPPQPMPFGGVIKESAKDSTPWWPPRVVPPKGAPNILLIMTDDQGYGVSGTFGGVIPTPAMDRIANAGLRYTEFHSTALCSPTRAAIITGRNHHSVGYGVIGELSTGYPGYDSLIGPDNAPSVRSFAITATPRRGSVKITTFPLFNTVLPGLSTNRRLAWAFSIFTGSSAARLTNGRRTFIATRRRCFRIGKPGYNLTTDLADDAIKYMSGLTRPLPTSRSLFTTSPAAPFAASADQGMDRKVQGQVRHGLRELRDQIFVNQKRLGVIPADTQLTPWPDGQAIYGGAKLPRWDSLSILQKKLYSREAEVFAAYAAYTDHEIGRVIQEVQHEGKLTTR